MHQVDRAPEARLSFDSAVAAYDEIRPTYPPAMFDALFALLPPDPDIVEVGPGTGQATRDLLSRGAVIRAIEISPRMAAQLAVNLPSENLMVRVGDFETIDIAEESTDAVFSATAYHWISPTQQLGRPVAILRPGSIIAIVDLIQVDSPEDRGFFAAVNSIYEWYGQGHVGPPAPSRRDVEPPILRALTRDRRFRNVKIRHYDWDQTYTASQYRKLMLSYSGTQMMNDHDREGLLDDIESFITERFDGHVTRPLVVTLTTATRV